MSPNTGNIYPDDRKINNSISGSADSIYFSGVVREGLKKKSGIFQIWSDPPTLVIMENLEKIKIFIVLK